MQSAGGIIFDMDGVLVDSEPYWRQGFRFGLSSLLADHGLPDVDLSDTDLMQFEGGRVSDTMRSLCERFVHADPSPQEIEAISDAVIARVSTIFRNAPTPILSAVHTIKALSAMGIPLGIATSSAPKFLATVLQVLEIDHIVQSAESAYHLPFGKPHPEVYENVLRRLNVDAARAIAVEDSTTGVESALRAGLRTVWFTQRSPKEATRWVTDRLGSSTKVPDILVSPTLSPDLIKEFFDER